MKIETFWRITQLHLEQWVLLTAAYLFPILERFCHVQALKTSHIFPVAKVTKWHNYNFFKISSDFRQINV